MLGDSQLGKGKKKSREMYPVCEANYPKEVDRAQES